MYNTKGNFKRSPMMKYLELKFGLSIEELLKQDYMDSKMSIRAMADKYEVNTTLVHRWLILLEIPRRKITFI